MTRIRNPNLCHQCKHDGFAVEERWREKSFFDDYVVKQSRRCTSCGYLRVIELRRHLSAERS